MGIQSHLSQSIVVSTFISCVLGLVSAGADAANIAWSVPNSGNFNLPSNWSGGVVPGVNDTVSLTLDATTTGSHPYTITLGSNVSTREVVAITQSFAGGEISFAPLTINLAGRRWSITPGTTGASGLAIVSNVGNPPILTLAGGGILDVTAPVKFINTDIIGATVVNSTHGAVTSGSTSLFGTGTRWAMTADLSLGVEQQHAGTLNISAGAQVTSASVSMFSYFDFGFGVASKLVVDGTGSKLSTGALSFTNQFGAASQVTVRNGGLIEVATINAGVIGTNVGPSIHVLGGTLATTALTAATGTVEFGSGTLKLGSFGLDNTATLGRLLELDASRSVEVAGATTLATGSELTVDGGRFKTGSLSGPGAFDFVSGEFELTQQNLTVGNSGLLGNFVAMGSDRRLLVGQDIVIDPSGQLSTGGGGVLKAARIVNQGQVLVDGFVSDLSAGSLDNSGLIIGSGRLGTRLVNAAGGHVRVGVNDFVQFAGSGDSSNDAAINVLGGTLEFAHGLANNAAGIIAGRGTLITGGTLVNRGRINVSGGITDIIGDVQNLAAGTIIASGGSLLTFYDDVVHNGSEIRVTAGSTAVYFGAVSGAGSFTGSGLNFFEGTFSPGNSPTVSVIEGDATFGDGSTLEIELGGIVPGSGFDQIQVGGQATLGGTLAFALLDEFLPSIGDTFTFLIATGELLGDFPSVILPSVSGIGFDLVRDTHSLSLVARAAPVPLPSAVWLFGAAVLMATRYRRAR